MPIRGLTDDVAPRLPSLGKLRKGAEKPQNGPGKDLSYFRFTGNKPEIEQAFEAAYGTAPGSLTVFLPYATADENFETWQEEWAAGGLVHRCDGQVMQIWREGAGFTRGAKPCPYFTGEKQRIKNRAPGCDEIGRLVVVLPELIRAGYVGYVTLETHSKNDMLNIIGALRDAESHAGDRGLAGIPFTLYRREEAISTPTDEGGRVTRKKWLVFIEPSAQWVSVRMQIAHAQALSLPVGDVVDAVTGEITSLAERQPVAQIAAPADRQYTEAQIGRPFDEDSDDAKDAARIAVATAASQAGRPSAPAPAATKATGNPPSIPTKAMWDKFNALCVEAKSLGLQPFTVDPDISAQTLAAKGSQIRAQIEQAKARLPAAERAAATAAEGEFAWKTGPELIEQVKDLAKQAIALNAIGPAWAVSPKWKEQDLLNAGRALLAKIQEAQHVHA
jgi:hypothetical protein